jgi:hypothetical protein
MKELIRGVSLVRRDRSGHEMHELIASEGPPLFSELRPTESEPRHQIWSVTEDDQQADDDCRHHKEAFRLVQIGCHPHQTRLWLIRDRLEIRQLAIDLVLSRLRHLTFTVAVTCPAILLLRICF